MPYALSARISHSWPRSWPTPVASDPPQAWCFGSADLQSALEARRLERDFGVDLQAAALILDLQREVGRLKAALRGQCR